MYCHEALALHAKLNDAGYRPEAERWLSDSESENSDNELEEDLVATLIQ